MADLKFGNTKSITNLIMTLSQSAERVANLKCLTLRLRYVRFHTLVQMAYLYQNVYSREIALPPTLKLCCASLRKGLIERTVSVAYRFQMFRSQLICWWRETQLLLLSSYALTSHMSFLSKLGSKLWFFFLQTKSILLSRDRQPSLRLVTR